MKPGLAETAEMNIPEELKSAIHDPVPGSPEVQEIHSKIWTDLTW